MNGLGREELARERIDEALRKARRAASEPSAHARTGAPGRLPGVATRLSAVLDGGAADLERRRSEVTVWSS